MFGIGLQLTHTGVSGSSLFISDISTGIADLGNFRKAGPVYVPVNQTITLVYTGDVAESFEIGVIRGFINRGLLTSTFTLGPAFLAAQTAFSDPFYAGTSANAALTELGIDTLGGTSTTIRDYTEENVVTDDQTFFASVNALDLAFGDLYSISLNEGASLIGVHDTAGYFLGDNVEDVLAELYTLIGSGGDGDTLPFTDTNNFYPSDLVGPALVYLGTVIGSRLYTEENVVTDGQSLTASINALDLKFGDLASTVINEGASLIGIHDTANYYTATNVEGALAEVFTVALNADLHTFTDAASFYSDDHVGASFAQLGTIIGTRIYTEQNEVTNGQSLTASINALDLAFGDLYSTVINEGASLIGVRDVANHFTGANVEAVLAELYTIATVATAHTFTDTNNFYPTDTVGAAFDYLGDIIGSRDYTEQNVITDGQSITESLEAIDLAFGDLYSTAGGEGSHLVGLSDQSPYTTAATAGDGLEYLIRRASSTIEYGVFFVAKGGSTWPIPQSEHQFGNKDLFRSFDTHYSRCQVSVRFDDVWQTPQVFASRNDLYDYINNNVPNDGSNTSVHVWYRVYDKVASRVIPPYKVYGMNATFSKLIPRNRKYYGHSAIVEETVRWPQFQNFLCDLWQQTYGFPFPEAPGSMTQQGLNCFWLPLNHKLMYRSAGTNTVIQLTNGPGPRWVYDTVALGIQPASAANFLSLGDPAIGAADLAGSYSVFNAIGNGFRQQQQRYREGYSLVVATPVGQGTETALVIKPVGVDQLYFPYFNQGNFRLEAVGSWDIEGRQRIRVLSPSEGSLGGDTTGAVSIASLIPIMVTRNGADLHGRSMGLGRLRFQFRDLNTNEVSTLSSAEVNVLSRKGFLQMQALITNRN